MSNVLHKKSILKKTSQMGGSVLLSRMLGLLREILQVQFMGSREVADMFRVAYMVPNLLRQIFAEGALSSAMVPNVVKMVKEKEHRQVEQLMSLSFLVFEGVLAGLIVLFIWKAETLISWWLPGWGAYEVETTAQLLRILMSFIFFISSSSLLAGALQAVHHFWVSAISPVILNIFFIGGLSLGLLFGLSITTFCYFILLGGLAQFALHFYMYFAVGFAFAPIDRSTARRFSSILKQFLPTMISGSVIQASFLVDTYFASHLPPGSITLLSISQGFLRIPLGLVVSFSTVLLAHFSRVSLSAPKRLSFYLLESAKFIVWFTLPMTIMMSFFAEKIFYTFFYSKHFSLAQVAEAKLILTAFLLSLFFISINKILLSMYYSFRQMWVPALITIVATGINILLCSWWVTTFQATGLALAMTFSQAFQTVFFMLVLRKKFKFQLYYLRFLNFLARYTLQVAVIFSVTYGLYISILKLITLLPLWLAHFFTMTVGIWLWAVPLMLCAMLVLYKTQNLFKVHLYFLGE